MRWGVKGQSLSLSEVRKREKVVGRLAQGEDMGRGFARKPGRVGGLGVGRGSASVPLARRQAAQRPGRQRRLSPVLHTSKRSVCAGSR